MGAALSVLSLGVAVGVTRCAPKDDARAPEGAETPSLSAAPARCSTELASDAPQLTALSEPKHPASTVVVKLAVPTSRIQRELDKQVPRGLASAKRQPVGSAGEVTYNVTRGSFGFALKDDRLVVSTPIAAKVSVCKPLGPLCPTYGRCAPKMMASASVPLLLDEAYRLGKPTVGYGISEGCSIVGMNVTSKIREVADARIGGVRGRIDRMMPDVPALAARAWKEVIAPRAFDGGCVWLQVDRVEQAKPELTDGTLRLATRASGNVLVAQTCPAPADAPLPPLSIVKGELGDGSEVRTSASIALEAVQASLTQVVSQPITDITATLGERNEKPVVLLAVRVDGAVCGVSYQLVDAVADPAARVVRLRNPRPASPADDHPAVKAALEKVLAEVVVPWPAHLTGAVKVADGFKPDLAQLDANAWIEDVTVDRAPLAASVALGPRILSVVVTQTGALAAVAKP